jgi:hypothetical protein
MSADRKLVKDVASELEARRRRRRRIFVAVWAALIAVAIYLVRCGAGWGIGGGGGTSTGKGPGTGSSTQPARCTVRVSAEGIFVDGEKRTRDEAVAACKKTDGAMVTVTGDARQGDWDELRAALQAVGVKIYLRGELWDGSNAPAGSGSAAQP